MAGKPSKKTERGKPDVQAELTKLKAALKKTRQTAKRAVEAERQRAAELQIINSIQQGLAAELHFQAIVDLVGNKLREVFNTPDLSIRWYDEKTNLFHFLYTYEHGERLTISPAPPQAGGPFESMRKTRQPMILNTPEDFAKLNITAILGTDMGKSMVFAPIIGGDRVLGMIGIENYERENAYGKSELRLLTTVAASLGTALENARLFTAEQERMTELAIINSVQEGLASKLDIQFIIDLIGDKLGEIFDDMDIVQINLYDEARSLIHIPYCMENGKRHQHEEREPWGYRKHVIESRQPLIINENEDSISEKYGNPVIAGEQPKSLAFVPLITGDKVRGLISLQSLKREKAFPQSTVQLLATLANSMSVALENARLFDEVQRKNAEITASLEREIASNDILRVIAASPTDVQPVLDVIVESARRLCNASMSEVYRTDGTMVYSVATSDISEDVLETAREVSSQSYPAPLKWDSTLSSRAILSREIVHIPDMEHAPDLPEITRRYVKAGILNSVLQVPMIREGEAIGAIGVGKRDPAPFTEKQIELMKTFASQAVIAIENVRLFNELEQRNAEITESLEYQTAISDILRVIAASPTDIQPVLDAISENALKLCGANFSAVYNYDGKMLDMTALKNFNPQATAEIQREYPRPLTRDGGYSARSILDKKIVHVIDTLNDPDIPESTRPFVAALGFRSGLWVPLIREDDAVGAFCVARPEPGPFDEKKIKLLQTFADQASIALENVRLFTETQRLLKETEQRNAELAIINSVQDGLAAELDFQAIVDLVGDKIRDIFNAQVVVLATFDTSKDLMVRHYVIEKGQRLYIEPRPIPNGWKDFIKNRQTWWVNTNFKGWLEERNSHEVPEDEMPKSVLSVPLALGDLYGAISLQNLDTENAFSESDVRLLQTLANSLSVALQNAQSFKAEQERAAELQIINSVQDGLASKLEMQAIYDLVGDKISEVTGSEIVVINTYDLVKRTRRFKYSREKGERQSISEHTFTPLEESTLGDLQAGKTIVWNEGMKEKVEQGDHSHIVTGGLPLSVVMVPLRTGKTEQHVIATISLQNSSREYAFSESDVRLVETLANSMSVALENARLFDETQRLLNETEQRAAELQIINSVQDGLASKLDVQAIYDLVGDKIRDIFHATGTAIYLFDQEKECQDTPYCFLKQRFVIEPHSYSEMCKLMIDAPQPRIYHNVSEYRALGGQVLENGEEFKSGMNVPLMVGREIKGMIHIANLDKENAYVESDLRLLTTLANSMSVALENARLFDETQRLLKETEQHAAELAIINSVQEGLASKLDLQGVYDLVGEKIRGIFDAKVVMIATFDEEAETEAFNYVYDIDDHPPRSHPESRKYDRLRKWLLKTGKTFVNNRVTQNDVEKSEATVFTGSSAPKSVLFVPLIESKTVKGYVSLQNSDHYDAFSESDVRLLQTLANSMSVALENARLFDETQRLLNETEQRAAELSIINSVQEGLARKLDMQAIYDLVGDKIREIFFGEADEAHVISIRVLDRNTNTIHHPYHAQGSERSQIQPYEIGDGGFGPHVLRTAKPLLLNYSTKYQAQFGGGFLSPEDQPPMGDTHWLGVPLLRGKEAWGVIVLENLALDREYTETDVRLLQTLANSMSVALENARLFDETQRLLNETEQRNAELAVINSIQAGLSSKLDMQAIYDLIGNKIRDIFDAETVAINYYDEKHDLISTPYMWSQKTRLPNEEPIPLSDAPLRKSLIDSRKPWIINRDVANIPEALNANPDERLGRWPKSSIGAPIIASDKVIGIIQIGNMELENAFTQADLHLLETIANSMSVALENVRLFNEAEESRAAAEHANQAKSAFLANMSHELRTPLNAIMGFTSIVRRKGEDVLPEKQIENLDKVLDSSEHLLHLINTVLDIAKIEAGRMDVQVADFLANPLMDLCANTAAPLVKPSVRLVKQTDDLGIVHSDQDKIKQIILNLLSNAAKFTADGEITLNARKENETLIVDVRDTGIGITAEALGKVFDEFQQADTSTTRQYGGTGLGLTISRDLARLLGGDLTAQSEYGEGSTFTLAVPIRYEPKPASPSDLAPDSAHPAESHPEAGQP